MKGINDNLDKQRIAMRQAYQSALINCLSDIWMNCTLIILNLSSYSLKEDFDQLTTETKIAEVLDVVHMNKQQQYNNK